MRLYPALGTLSYRFIKPLLRFYPRTHRVRCLLLHEDHVLLVKNWLGRGQWTLPGGGIHRAETTQRAAIRELEEELKVRLKSRAIRELGPWEETIDGMDYWFELCSAWVPSREVHRNHRELVACQWFRLGRLPDQRTAVVDEALRRFKAQL